ncbi:hypothetical protein F0U62_36215 [Cystobacter fuscus]|nr:hypothetical protein F0U62_36215 [Cystobacter fuscus]
MGMGWPLRMFQGRSTQRRLRALARFTFASNHFHLLVWARGASLASFMQDLRANLSSPFLLVSCRVASLPFFDLLRNPSRALSGSSSTLFGGHRLAHGSCPFASTRWGIGWIDFHLKESIPGTLALTSRWGMPQVLRWELAMSAERLTCHAERLKRRDGAFLREPRTAAFCVVFVVGGKTSAVPGRNAKRRAGACLDITSRSRIPFHGGIAPVLTT